MVGHDQFGLYNILSKTYISILNVKAKIIDTIGKVKITQTYQNLEDEENELSYSFPIDELSVVNSFKVILKDEEIIGKIYEKEEAIQKYENAINNDKTAVLLEVPEDNTDIFKITIGNFPKDTQIKIEICYVTEIIKNTDKEIRFYFPKVISNKFGMNPQNKIDYDLDFEAKITTKSKIKDITSYGYQVTTEIKNNKAKVSFSSKIKDVDSFYLTVKNEETSEIRNWVEIKNKNEKTLSIMTIIPSKITKDIFEKKNRN
jgi:hypothetical protein